MAEFPFQVGGKWTGMIVVSLLDGPLRFGELRQALGPVTAKVLTETLRDMQRDGLVTRLDRDANPPHVEYELTALGRSLVRVIDAMREWSRGHLAELLAHRQRHNTSLCLVVPDERLHAAWLDAHAEWGPGLHEDGFGLLATDEVRTTSGFSAWIARLAADASCTYRWIVEDGSVLGGIALRHGTGEFVRRAGHIGYGIRPGARGRGVATWALGEMLAEAARRGMDHVVLVCAANNTASARTIERHGGVLESLGEVRRYRIACQGHFAAVPGTGTPVRTVGRPQADG
ncbi:GNAT family N-acetyltransferase [Amycolatopsis sp. NEAU-NG30]|uniref:GNAT family N-acetyltransferase n=1 Tax=Amycolatopsis melonis TaxID=3156488 RepID=A0ABV0LTW2_9PSEU